MPISKSEQSFIKSAILADPPQRADGRTLQEFRPIALQTGGNVAPLANGSGRVNLGGSEVIAAVKLEAEDIERHDAPQSDETLGRDGGRVVCTVSWFVSTPLSSVSQLSVINFTHPPLFVEHGKLAISVSQQNGHPTRRNVL